MKYATKVLPILFSSVFVSGKIRQHGINIYILLFIGFLPHIIHLFC